MNRNYLKRFVAWVTGLKDRFRYDIFFRTTVIIVATQTLFTTAIMLVFWWAIAYTESKITGAVGSYIVDVINHYPERPDVNFSSIAENIQRESIIYVFTLVLAVSVFLGYILSRVTLLPARQSLQYQKRFIGNVAHELRTPLSTIKTSSEVALLDPNLDPEVRSTILEHITELDRISEIINNLLSFNALIRPERMDFKNVVLIDVVEKVLHTLGPLARSRGVTLQVRKYGAGVVYGNAVALEQLVANIIKNAINYTPIGSKKAVVVSIFPCTDESPVFAVADQGVGMDQETLHHIFEPFYRGDNSRVRGMGGTSGLGLTIVNEILRVHKGKIHIQSDIGRGTEVFVALRCGRGSFEETSKTHTFDPLPRTTIISDESWNEVSHDYSDPA